MRIVDPARLLDSLRGERECEWLEFKRNKFEAEEAGQYISALANSAMLHDQEHGYFVFGVDDKTHEVVGTTVRLKDEKIGEEPFENWVSRLLHPRVLFEIVSFEHSNKHVELICIYPAYLSPVRFKNEAYIRVDSVLKPLRDYEERERALWAITSRFSFEKGIVAANLSSEQLFEQFDPAALFSRLGVSRLSQSAMIERLVKERLLNDNKQGGYDATNLLALLAARDLGKYPHLARKSLRSIQYAGPSKIEGRGEFSGRRGLALGFLPMLGYIMERISHKELMRHGERETVYAIPEIAIRELIANALIHQDLTVQGAGPVIEIYSDRIKITNPGKPFVEPDRLIDAPPRSRNEDLAGFMKRMSYCEERGSGVDRALEAIEKAAMTPPLFQVVDNTLVVTVFAAKSFSAMTKEERIRACYQHAALRWEANMPMSNQSLRNRFALPEAQYSQVSIVISDAKEAGLIKPQNEGQANRLARYLPHWA